MRELIVNILKERGMMKVIELAFAVWLCQTKREIPNVWKPSSEELSEIKETERWLFLFLPQMLDEGIIEADPDWKYIKLREVLAA